MTNKKDNVQNNIFCLDEIRSKKITTTAQLLKNSKKVTAAISTRTCLVCNSKKACVGKTGVCSYCFDHLLTHEEKIIAEEEAKHKIIRIQVIDDRWEK
jgi:hypothetical protein